MPMTKECKDFFLTRMLECPLVPTRSGRHSNVYTHKTITSSQRKTLRKKQKEARRKNREK